MLPPPTSLFEIWALYQKSIQACSEPRQVKNILNETQSALFRLFLPGLNPALRPAGRKMTQAETQADMDFMHTIAPAALIDARTTIAVELANLSSLSSQKTYGKRLEQFLNWSEGEYWWDQIHQPVTELQDASSKEEYCPRLRRGFGRAGQNHLTERRYVYPAYALKPEAIITQ